MLRQLFLIFALTVFVSKSSPLLPNNGRILGGTNAEDGQFPFQVSLWVGNSFNCGATILNNMFVITAANCIQKLRTHYIRAGSVKLNSKDAIKIKVAKIYIHEDYNPTSGDSDLAILKLSTPLEFNDRVGPAKLPTGDTPDDTDLIVTGWGDTKYPNGHSAETLQVLDVKSFNRERCEEIMETRLRLWVTTNNMCALNTKGKGICYGDGGSALLNKDVIVGVAIWLRPCATGRPDIYTNVYNYVDWIEKIISSN